MSIARLGVMVALLGVAGTAYAGPVEDAIKRREVRVKITPGTAADETWRRVEGGALRFIESQSAMGGTRFAQPTLAQHEWEPVTLSTSVTGAARIDSSLGAVVAISPLTVRIPLIAAAAGAVSKEKAYRPGAPAVESVTFVLRQRDGAVRDWVRMAYDGKDARKDVTVTVRDAKGGVLRDYKLISSEPVSYNRVAYGDAREPAEVIVVRPQRINVAGLAPGSGTWLAEAISATNGRRDVRITEGSRTIGYAQAFITEYSVGPFSSNASDLTEKLAFAPGTSADYLK